MKKIYEGKARDIYEVENCMESKGFVSVSNISRKL